jgi:hypothetical protein
VEVMEIVWNENPLFTKVILNDTEKELLEARLLFDDYASFSCGLHMGLERNDTKYVHELIRRTWGEFESGSIQKDNRGYAQNLIQALENDMHIGDCTCEPASCTKCGAEDLMKINTLEGLGKHEARKIMAAFSKNEFGYTNDRTINEALEILSERPEYKMSKAWKNTTQEEYEVHIPRWEKERENAYAWLLKYKQDHFDL